jgi:lipopolysaccharide export system permease protein
MRTLGGYLTRIFILRWLMVLSGLVLFVSALDLLANGDDAMAVNDGELSAMLRYALLRLPKFLSELLPIAALLAGLLTALRLIRHSEFVAIWNTGTSQFRIMLALVPVALAVGAIQFAIDDRLVPMTTGLLRDWQMADYDEAPSANVIGGQSWYHAGTDIVRAPLADTETGALENIRIFRRDREGHLLAKLDVRTARRGAGGWILFDVTDFDVATNRVTRHERLSWPRELRLRDLVLGTAHPSDLSLLQLISFTADETRGAWPRHFYRTWLQHKLAGFFIPMLMIFLAVALSQRFQRSGALGLLFTAGIACGFGYFVLNGVTLALGEVRLLPAFLAGWAPLFILASITGSIAFHHEMRSKAERRAAARGAGPR